MGSFGTTIENFTYEDELPLNVEGFWTFCLERERIRLAKEAGEPFPWTRDKILSKYHFCNVRREDDYGTRWYVENLAKRVSTPQDLLWKTTLYRAVNNIEWFKSIGGVFSLEQWRADPQDIYTLINVAQPPYSLAHKVLQGPDGADRKTHLIEHLTWLEVHIEDLTQQVFHASTLEDVWKYLQMAPFIGPFISLQIYRDLILVGALPFSDNDFVYLGPGCRRGLELLFPEIKQYKQQYWSLQEIRDLHPDNLELSLGDVEHAMCEWRKYQGLKAGGGRHRFYHPHEKTTD